MNETSSPQRPPTIPVLRKTCAERGGILWYDRFPVGTLFPYIKNWEEGFASREPAGYINVVYFGDAEIVHLTQEQIDSTGGFYSRGAANDQVSA